MQVTVLELLRPNKKNVKNVFSFKSISVLTYIKINFTKSLETICFLYSVRALQMTRQPRSKS